MNEINNKKRIDGYITLPSISKQNIMPKDLNNIFDNTGINNIKFQVEEITKQILPLYTSNIEQFVIPLQIGLQKFAEAIKPLIESMATYTQSMTPYFSELAETLEKAQKNPNSLMNWSNYSNKLNKYLWTFPYGMTSESLKEILSNVNSEKEFDKYMLKYFNKEVISNLENDISHMLPKKHKVMFKQIMNSFYNKNYAISNVGITAIIDDLCTYFLEDKGCNKRLDLLLPIIEELDDYSENKFEVLSLMILNNNLNIIYEKIVFQKRISISTNKKVRRHTSQHGRKFVNKKIDTVMLLNTIYYMLTICNQFSVYKHKLVYVRNKKDLNKVQTKNSVEIDRFYIKKKYYRKSLVK